MRYILTAICVGAIAAPASAGDIKFKPLIDARLRYETVDQQGIANTADSVTLRLRWGGEASKGPFSLLAEAESTIAIGPDYNSGVNGKAAFPIVADPQNVELNRLQFQYKTKPLTVTVGRQRINLDDQRFVGAVGWRQNEQTFDAARVEWTAVKGLKVDVTYAISARTIWGIDGGSFGATNRPTEMDGDNIFANVSYKFKPVTITAFAYLVEQELPVVALRRLSSQTYGVRLNGATPLSKSVKLSYAASYARQTDDQNNPVSYAADYAAVELGLEVKSWKLTAGYELLGSDATATGIAGGFGFQTPYATLHKFNGWADKFLTTPQTGLQDYYASVAWTSPKLGKKGPLTLTVAYHRFDSDRNSIHYGDELNAQAVFKLTKRTSFTLKYADYQREGIASYPGDADTKKFWAQIDYSL